MDISNETLSISLNDVVYNVETSKQLSNDNQTDLQTEINTKQVESAKIQIQEKQNTSDTEKISPEQVSIDKDNINKQQENQKTAENLTEENVTLQNGLCLKFRIEEKENQLTGETEKEVVVYMLDKETGEIVRRIPPEEYKDLYKDKLNINKLGFFMDYNI